jgi:hypothetical protein
MWNIADRFEDQMTTLHASISDLRDRAKEEVHQYSDKPMPIGGYTVLLGTYALLSATGLIALSRRKEGLKLPGVADIALLGVATHKISRIITKDWVTIPLRAPFVEYREPRSGGEVSESSRGSGLRRAVGDLLTCPFCFGPWVAGVLYAGYLTAPAATRVVASVFASVTVSDFLHRAYRAADAAG